eukprot:m.28944 g.28944  ORF g.28944 m.28944 type:complete len:446 (-) comp10489_c0_seq4:836-2173(-)
MTLASAARPQQAVRLVAALRALSTSSSSLSASSSAGSSWQTWAHVKMGPPDPILGLTEAYKKDDHPKKVNLGVGAYRDDSGKPFVLQCVVEAERRILDAALDKEYASIHGTQTFREETARLALDNAGHAIHDGRVATVQTISGTGGLRVAGMFLAEFYNFPKNEKAIYVPSPTWGNHQPIFKACGLEPRNYTYYNKETYGLNFEGMMKDLDGLPEGSVVLLHACAQNPTGVDPTAEQWRDIAALFQRKRHLPVFDMAYQGFASGDPELDAFAVQHFLNEGLNPFVIQSYSKNMGLYGERVGALNIVTASRSEAQAVESQLKILIRPLYSNPPVHGARIVSVVLGDPALRSLWLDEMHSMASRIHKMRAQLVHELKAAGSTLDWSHIEKQNGMFCFSGLTEAEVGRLIHEYHIYLTKNGRISVAGICSGNVAYLAQAMHEVTAHRT